MKSSQMLRHGCTRLEIGVQSVYHDVARDTHRGYTICAVSESFRLAKDAPVCRERTRRVPAQTLTWSCNGRQSFSRMYVLETEVCQCMVRRILGSCYKSAEERAAC